MALETLSGILSITLLMGGLFLFYYTQVFSANKKQKSDTELIHRSFQVLTFRQNILSIARFRNLENDFDRVEKIMGLHDKYSYEEMVNSNKPLRLEEWYSPEELKILLG